MIGNVPDGWRVEKLGNLCQVFTGKRDANHGEEDGKYPFYTCSAQPIKSNTFSFSGKSILLAGNGNLENMFLYDGHFEAYQRTYILQNLDKELLYEYLFFNLKRYWIEYNSSKQYGSIINYIKMENITKYPILIPPLPQQEKIVKVLDISSSLIEKQKEIIADYDLFLKSKFIEMFGDIKNNPYNFDIEPLSKFGKIITGNTPPRKELENYDDNFIEWIKTDNISPNELYISTAKEYLSELGMSKGRILDKGGLLITCIAGSLKSVGNIAMTDRKITFNQQINAIQPNKNVNSLYLYWLIKLNKNYIHTFATSSMKKMISKGVFQEIPFIKAPFDLQNKFSEIASRVDTIKTKETQKLEHLETLHKSLMDKAFKGEIQ